MLHSDSENVEVFYHQVPTSNIKSVYWYVKDEVTYLN